MHSLLEVADMLDCLGLRKEADALDRILQKRADALAYKEKPFLAQLAKIMLALRQYRSGEVITDDLTFPITGLRLMGLSRQAAIEEVQKHLKAFVEQFLLPNLDRAYKGTKAETGYRKFISESFNLLQMLQGIFSVRSEQQSIREGVSAVEQVKKMVGHLMVYVRSEGQLGKSVDPQVEAILQEALQILGNIEIAVRQLNESEVKKSVEQLLVIFPREIDSDSPIYDLVVKAFKKGDVIPFVRQNVVEEEAKERLDIAQEVELNQGLAQEKKFETELVRKRDLERHALELEERARDDQAEAAKYEFPTRPIDTFKEFEANLKKMPNTYLMPERKVSQYKNKYRRYEVISGDLSNLEKWLVRYKENSEVNQVVSFSNFLSKMVDNKKAKQAFDIINLNIADLKDEVERDIRATEKALFAVQRDLFPLKQEWNNTKNHVIWDLWHEQYIVKMIQVLNYVLAPETRGEETSVQAFNKVLSKFNELLNYKV